MTGDITRCLGEGSAGRICDRRDRCARHRALAEDRAADERSGRAPWRNHADLLCRHPHWAFFLPLEGS